MTEWLAHPEKDGPYWFLAVGAKRVCPRWVSTEPDGTRYVAKFGDDWEILLSKYKADDRWLPIPEPPLPDEVTADEG